MRFRTQIQANRGRFFAYDSPRALKERPRRRASRRTLKRADPGTSPSRAPAGRAIPAPVLGLFNRLRRVFRSVVTAKGRPETPRSPRMSFIGNKRRNDVEILFEAKVLEGGDPESHREPEFPAGVIAAFTSLPPGRPRSAGLAALDRTAGAGRTLAGRYLRTRSRQSTAHF